MCVHVCVRGRAYCGTQSKELGQTAKAQSLSHTPAPEKRNAGKRTKDDVKKVTLELPTEERKSTRGT